ncbi:MAG: ATP-binding protein [Planctomycetaceae bacterium]
MRWSIRHQVLLPIAGVVLLAVAATTAVAAWLAARDRERATLDQLARVVTTLAEARFPVNDSVVAQMRGLTGAHFVAFDDRRELVASTLELSAVEQARLADRAVGDLATLTRQPAVAVGAERCFVARLERATDRSARWLYVLAPEGTWRREQWLAALYPLSVGAMAVLLTAGVTWAWGQRLARRLQTLQGQTAAIARGEFAAIPPQGADDELRDLEVGVNRMAERLRELQAAISVGERQRVLAQLAGGLAHQLRNAATGARLALQLHAQRCRPGGADRSLEVALRQLSLLEMQVRGLLSLGKPERREPRRVAAAALIGEVVPLIEPACEHAGVRLGTGGCAAGGEVLGDAHSLQAAVLNLALNAVEAAGRGGVVEVRQVVDEGWVRLEVADSGPGPNAEVAGQLGQPFVTTKPEGVGLGLLLVRQVAEEHGGRLEWQRGEERTVFTLTLPLAQPGGEFEAGVTANSATHSRTDSAVELTATRVSAGGWGGELAPPPAREGGPGKVVSPAVDPLTVELGRVGAGRVAPAQTGLLP